MQPLPSASALCMQWIDLHRKCTRIMLVLMGLFGIVLVLNYYFPVVVVSNNTNGRLFFIILFLLLGLINYLLFKYYGRHSRLSCPHCQHIISSSKSLKRQIQQIDCIQCGQQRISTTVDCHPIKGHHPLKSLQHSIVIQIILIILAVVAIGVISAENDHIPSLIWMLWLMIFLISWMMQRYIFHKARKLDIVCHSCGFYPKDIAECQLMLCDEIICCEKSQGR